MINQHSFKCIEMNVNEINERQIKISQLDDDTIFFLYNSSSEVVLWLSISLIIVLIELLSKREILQLKK